MKTRLSLQIWPTLLVAALIVANGVFAIPGDKAPLEGVHPGFKLINLRPADLNPMVTGLDWMSDGRLVVSHWGGEHKLVHTRQTQGKVFILSGVTGDNPKVTFKEFASGLEDPMGLAVVDDEIYVTGGNALLHLEDGNKDGSMDNARKVWSNGDTHGRHEFFFGLLYRDGKFYGNMSSEKGTNLNNDNRGTHVVIDKATGAREIVAAGLRTPNGIGWGPDGEIFVPDVQGHWLPSNKLIHIKKGRYYGFRLNDPKGWANTTESPPVVYIPQKEIGQAPSQPLLVRDGIYKNQFLMGDAVNGGIRRVFLEKVAGEYQGCLLRFSQGLEAGIERMVYGPDGMIYLGGVGGEDAGWSHKGRRFGLQKLKPSGQVAFEMLAVRSRPKGMEIEFTKPAGASADAAGNYEVKTWSYKPTAAYGGPKVGEKALSVKSVQVNADRSKAYLEIAGLEKGNVVYIRLAGVKSGGGESPWATEGWYTLNAFGSGNPFDPPTPITNTLAADHKQASIFRIVRGESGVLADVNLKSAYEVKLLDLNGRMLSRSTGNAPGRHNLESIDSKPGLYLVRVEDLSGGKTQTLRVMLP